MITKEMINTRKNRIKEALNVYCNGIRTIITEFRINWIKLILLFTISALITLSVFLAFHTSVVSKFNNNLIVYEAFLSLLSLLVLALLGKIDLFINTSKIKKIRIPKWGFVVACLIILTIVLYAIESLNKCEKPPNYNEILLKNTIYLVFVGIFEESVFRGIILSLFRYNKPDYLPSQIIGVIVSSVLFGILHLNNGSLGAMVSAIGLGCILGTVVFHFQNIIPSIIIHVLWDGMVVLLNNPFAELTRNGVKKINSNVSISILFILFIIVPLLYLTKAAGKKQN